MNAAQSSCGFIIVYTGVLHVLNYSILAKPSILLYYFAVVCSLLDKMYWVTLPPPPYFSLFLSLRAGVSAHGAHARVITFWREARHHHYKTCGLL